MLHAVCASIDGTICTSAHGLGTELWAFMPAVQLPLVGVQRPAHRWLSARHRRVRRLHERRRRPARSRWHTVLTFQTGYSNSTEGGKAGRVRHRRHRPVQAGLAVGVHDARERGGSPTSAPAWSRRWAPTLSTGSPTNLAVLETNNGGTGTAGMVATARAARDRRQAWQFTTTYPTAAACRRPRCPAVPSVSTSPATACHRLRDGRPLRAAVADHRGDGRQQVRRDDAAVPVHLRRGDRQAPDRRGAGDLLRRQQPPTSRSRPAATPTRTTATRAGASARRTSCR